MASGHVNRTNRPNTWLHRPACGREESPCQLGAVHTWHFGDIASSQIDFRFRGDSGRAAEMTEFDRPCVKTHTSAKCRKHNSPARHRTSRVQYDLTLRDAIAQRYFYVWRDRRSFRTAKTRFGHT